jgi:hypothetical protein
MIFKGHIDRFFAILSFRLIMNEPIKNFIINSIAYRLYYIANFTLCVVGHASCVFFQTINPVNPANATIIPAG